MKVYITTYCLSRGIEHLEVIEDLSNNCIRYINTKGEQHICPPTEYFTDRDQAVKAAERARLKKIALTEKTLEKLKKMKF